MMAVKAKSEKKFLLSKINENDPARNYGSGLFRTGQANGEESCVQTLLRIVDGGCRHNTKCACTILLLAKKIKFFISIPRIYLEIFVNRKIENISTKRASLCKGWGGVFFFVKIKKEQKRGGASRPNVEFRIWNFKETEMKNRKQNQDYFSAANRFTLEGVFSSTRRLPQTPKFDYLSTILDESFCSNTRLLPCPTPQVCSCTSRIRDKASNAVVGKNNIQKRRKPVNEPLKIELSWGKYTIVDAEDFEKLKMYKWCSVKMGQNWYAKTFRTDGTHLSMHRLITNAPKHLVVDHRDHNGLNNRKDNLRLCTPAQNQYNTRPRPGGTSRHKGVHFDKKIKKYRALINHKSKRYHIGCFINEDDAARAYDRKAIELFGEFAYLNFPDENYA